MWLVESHTYTNIQMYSVKYYKYLQKQNYKSSWHTQDSSTELKHVLWSFLPVQILVEQVKLFFSSQDQEMYKKY